MRHTALLILIITLLAISHNVPLIARYTDSSATGAALPLAVTRRGVTAHVSFKNVSLDYPISLATEVKPELVPASPLEQESDKPDGVYPEHIAFKLVGLSTPHPQSFEPVLRVCPVAEYKQAFSVNKAYVRAAEQILRELRQQLRRKPATLRTKVPTLPFPDATDAFHAHVRYLCFKHGSGVIYLTQSRQDANLINNEEISYEFRGLTDDGRYYVIGSFPVAAPFLPNSRYVNSFDGYTLPDEFYGKNQARHKRAYAAYTSRMRLRLEKLSVEEFQPKLRLYDEMLSSLEIRK